MTDEPMAANKATHGSEEVQGAISFTASLSRKTPEAPDSNKENKSDAPRTKSEYIFWPVIAIGRLARWCFLWLNDHDGAVVALATIVIAWLTFNYSDYAKKQWKSMERQADISEISQASRLVIEKVQPTIIPGKFFEVEVAFSVKNVGPTVANDIAENVEFSTLNVSTGERKPAQVKYVAEPNPNGPSLGQGQDKTYTERSNGTAGLNDALDEISKKFVILGKNGDTAPLEFRVPSDDVLTGKVLYLISPKVSYNDIFKRSPHITSDCVMYDAPTKTFVSCPTRHQHD